MFVGYMDTLVAGGYVLNILKAVSGLANVCTGLTLCKCLHFVAFAVHGHDWPAVGTVRRASLGPDPFRVVEMHGFWQNRASGFTMYHMLKLAFLCPATRDSRGCGG